jgi:glycosyltransferase involved in cell wall biosynthesis
MLKPYLGGDVDYITIGTRSDNENGFRLLTRILGDFGRFCRVLKKNRHALVHLNPSLGKKALLRDGLLITIARMRGCKVLVFIHGWNGECEAVLRERYLPLFQRVYFKADAFIVLSREFKEKLISMGCEKPIFVETTTVDEYLFSLHKPPPQNEHFRILYLARVEREKGIYETLDAYQQVKARHPYTTLQVVGDGSELTNARAYAKDKGIANVEFSGYLTGERKDAAFREADIFLFPTWYGEGMPINVLEAMACAIPVITRPVGGIKDFFEDGRMGFISETTDPKIFAGLIERLIVKRELGQCIGAYNRGYAEKNFSPAKVAGNLCTIYAQIMSSINDRTKTT